MAVFRTGNNAYAITLVGSGSTGVHSNTAGWVDGNGAFGPTHAHVTVDCPTGVVRYGEEETPALAYEINAEAGAYAVAGSAATLAATRVLVGVAGSYSLTGAAATLARAYPLNAATGSYALSGAAATLLQSRLLVASSGSYGLSGAAATLAAGRLVSFAPGVYTLTGVAANLIRTTSNNYVLTADVGAYALSGAAATLAATRLVVAVAGSCGLTGSAAGLTATRALTAATGSYTLTGVAASLEYVPASGDRVMVANPGAYVLTGFDAADVTPRPSSGATGLALVGIEIERRVEVEVEREREPEEPEPVVRKPPVPPAPPSDDPVTIAFLEGRIVALERELEERDRELGELRVIQKPEAGPVAPMGESAALPAVPSVVVEAPAEPEAEPLEQEPLEMERAETEENETTVTVDDLLALPEPTEEEIIASALELAEEDEGPAPALVPAPIAPSPIATTIIAATPEEAARLLVEQIPDGYSQDDMTALILAVVEALT